MKLQNILLEKAKAKYWECSTFNILTKLIKIYLNYQNMEYLIRFLTPIQSEELP